jgi:hypothetical protein
MATKKIKRFESGGVSDKDRGLEASKEDKVGFFERMRMGNIDEEGSEAYRRFGAGRGKAERTPVETMEPSPVRQSAAAAVKPEIDPLEEANAREPIPVPAGPKARPGESGSSVKIGGKPSISSSAPAKSPVKQAQTYSRTSGDTGERSRPDTSNYSNEGRAMAAPATPKPSNRRGTVDDIPLDSPRKPVTGEKVDSSELGRNVATTMAALGPVKGAGAVRAVAEFARANRVQDAFNKTATARRTAEMRAKGDATKFSSKPKATQKDSAKKTKKFDDEESNTEFKRGGMVSSASKRADGIATKGKTRCKMR